MGVEQSGPMEPSPGASPSRTKQDADAASDTSSLLSLDQSDRRDADALLQLQMQAKSEEYRMLFRLPPDEVLIQDFNCALQENILLQGHMYLFTHHICFYSNIFGFESKKTIPFHEITCVRKAKTAAIFPNAIEIVAGVKKHFFGSFLSRDEAYRLIVDGWAQHSNEARAFLDHQEIRFDTNAEEYGVVMSDKSNESKRSSDGSSSPDRDVLVSEECKSSTNGRIDIEIPLVSEVTENIENAVNLSPREQLKRQLEDVDSPKIPEYFTMVAEAKFPVHVEDFFKLFISDSGAELLQTFHTKCGDKDFRCTPWRKHEQFGHVRDVSFLHPVKIYFGAKFGRCQEVQKFRMYRNGHLMIETSQQVSDVPYGDYFQVEGVWDVEQERNEDNGCVLRVYSNVMFSKKTFFKGKIEQSTKEECREVYAIWIDIAQKLLKQKNVIQLGETSQDSYVESASYLKLDEPSEELRPLKPSSKILHAPLDVKSFSPPIISPLQEYQGYLLSIASVFVEKWAGFVSYLTSQRHFTLFLGLAFAAAILLMQITIIILVARAPEVHAVPQSNYVSNFGGHALENAEWLEKQFSYLKEEMHMLETRMERMHHEYTMLKGRLQSLSG